MPVLESVLRDCISNIQSAKATERKKGIESLKEYLQQEDVITIINKHSDDYSNSSLCWNSIFQSCHNVLLQAADKIYKDDKLKSRPTLENSKKMCGSLVTTVVSKANSNIQYLDCNTVIKASLQVLESNVYKNIVGDRYVKILNEFVFPSRKCWGKIKLEFWNDLYLVSLKLYEEPLHDCKASDVISMLNVIIRYGCECSSLAILVKKRIFGFLKKITNGAWKENDNFQVKVLSLLITVCEKLQKECRKAVCKFGEEVLQSVLNMYQMKIGVNEKKIMLFHFLLIIVEAHHPNGVEENSSSAYAHDWSNWKKGLQRINCLAATEINNTLKHEKSDTLCPNFLNLMVHVYKQIFYSCGNSLDVTVGRNFLDESALIDFSTSKRMRITSGLPDLIERLQDIRNFSEMWPWLCILHELLQRYPELVNESDYMMLLRNISKFLSTSKESLVTDYLCKCCIPLIHIRKKLNLDDNDLPIEETILESIGQTVLRTIGLNQSIQWSHSLLQHMLKHLWKPSMGHTILKLYLSGAIRLSDHSIMTLYLLRQRISFPISLLEISVSSSLLRWMFPEEQTNDYILKCNLELYAHMLILLCLKNNVKSEYVEVEPLQLNLSHEKGIPAWQIFALTSYESDLFLKDELIEKESSRKTNTTSSVLNEESLEQLIHFLEDLYSSVSENCRKLDDKIEAFRYVSNLNLLFLHIQKFQNYYHIEVTSKLKTLSYDLIERLVAISEKILSANNSQPKLEFFTYLSEFFKQLGILPLNIVDFILKEFFESLKFVFQIIEDKDRKTASQEDIDAEMVVENDSNVSLFSTELLSQKDKLKVEACKVLVYYSYNHERVHDIQNKVFVSCLETVCELREDLSPLCLLQMAAITIDTALKMKNVDSNIIDTVTRILQALCELGEWYMIEESAVVILNFIQRGIYRVGELVDKSPWQNLEILVNGIEKATPTHGPCTVTEVVRCFGLFVMVGGFNKYRDSESVYEIFEKLLLYLKHEFHEVRMITTRYISEIFKLIDLSYKNGQPKIDRNRIFSAFKDVLFSVFYVENELTDEEIDENVNRPMTVLYSLASAICYSQIARREALLLLFHITHEKRLSGVLSYKILKLIHNKLKLLNVTNFIKNNSLYLLWNWFKKYNTFENFPFQILNYKLDVEFYDTFLEDIIPVLLFYGKKESVSEIARKLDLGDNAVSQRCFSEVMALLLRKIIETPCSSDDGVNEKVIHTYLENSVGSEKFKDLMIEKLPDVLVSLFRSLHDPNFEIPPRSILPSPAPFRADERLLLEMIDYLQSTTEQPDSPLIAFITCQYQDHSQKIFQQLYIDVVNSSTPEIRLESFQKYVLFCQLLLPYYDDLFKYHSVAFITRTVVLNLIHFVSSDSDHLIMSISSLRFFKKFTSMWLSGEANKSIVVSVFNDLLSTVVDKLVSIASKDNDLGKEALSLLNYLLNDKGECLVKGIQDLEPFPDLPQFESVNMFYIQIQDTQTDDMTLINDCKKFIKVEETTAYSTCRVESLKFLRKKLSENKYEMGRMIKELHMKRGFSENCVDSVPHRLICSLLQLINSGDKKVSYEAACCLGEIGLIDLNTLALQPNCDAYDEKSVAEILVTTKLTKMLIGCVVEKEVDVIKTASKALYATLASAEGYTVAKDKLEKMEKLFILPYIPSTKPTRSNLWDSFDAFKFKETMENTCIWTPIDAIPFNMWIVNLVCSILNAFRNPCYLYVVQEICRIKVTFAEELFKYLINLLLKNNYEDVKNIVSERINQFFKNHFTSTTNEIYTDSYTSSHSSKNLVPEIHSNKMAVKCFLDVVHFVRLKQENPNTNDLKLNYLYVAKAAQYCSLYFTSVLYAEFWINFHIQNSNIDNDGNVLSALEKIGLELPDDKNELLNILREAFSKIGDSDALYGCGSSLLLQPETRILHYVQTENWTRVMESCDTQLNSGLISYSTVNNLSAAAGLAGFTYLQNQYLSSLTNLNSTLKDAFYESGWKLGKWDLSEPSDDEKTYGYYQYAALKDIQQKNIQGAKTNVEQARNLIIPILARIGLESTKNIYHALSKLQCLQDIEECLKNSNVADLLDTWSDQDELNERLSFKYKETILNQRIRIIELENETSCDFILKTAKLARKERNFNYADSCLSLIKHKNAPISNFFQMKLNLEEAKILWSRKETHVARYMLKNLLNFADLKNNKSFHSKLLRIYGSWLSEINLENADTIFSEYFIPATSKITDHASENHKERKSRLKTFKCVAEFADSQYQQISKYIKSDDFQRQQQSVKDAKMQSDALGGQSIDVRKTKNLLANQSKIDDLLVTEIRDKQNRYLLLAMESYLRLLTDSEEEELRMFRVISLWLENKKHGELNLLVRKMIPDVPSYKFISVLPQLIAHITRNWAEGYGHTLNKVIEKCALQHPHHTLPLILSLAKYLKDDAYSENKGAGKVTKEERVLAACEYIKRFSQNDTIGEIVSQMETVSDAYIELAYFSIGKQAACGESFNILSNLAIGKLQNVDKALCPTITLPVSKTAQYRNIIGIKRIESKFMAVGGINAPKKINCLCTDGITRPQLVKGRDDIRQDAVMQQVFTIMNKLLSQSKNASKRKLQIRTYKVIPLSQRSGILEWCTNTMSFSDYLAYKSEAHPGAHKQYRPQDLTTVKARQRIDSARDRSDDEKLKVYKTVCKNLKPVFRYFFLEKYPSPTKWFERKLAYIHSVAVTSIVGYIIGLGDRHVQNMLIDIETAEVIHIDFGVAFDQGLLLNFPERIPFRLTRDIEDGMGAFSIDGIFRRCCEQTLAVLRQNKNIIQTTIEVFLYDPLYQWTVTPEKKATIQSSSRKSREQPMPVAEVNVTAPRALAGVISKLQGLDEGTYTTIEGQVNRLIQQAKDPYNLCRLYCGWQAYL